MFDLVVAHGTLVTMDPERHVIRGGAVGIRDDRIVAIEENPGALPAATRFLDATGKIVLPGFVDSHGHAGHALTRGLGDGWDGDRWLTLMETIYDHASDETFWRAESALAALERLKFGVTTSLSMTGGAPRVDDPRYALAAASGYVELGLRHVVAVGPPSGRWPRRYTDRTRTPPAAVELGLDDALRVTDEALTGVAALKNARLTAALAPSAIWPSTETVMAERVIAGLVGLRERHGVALHAHAYRGMIRAAHAVAPDLFGPGTSLAHCAGIDDGELDLLARTGTSASHGPLTHAYAEQRFPLIEALERGVNVAISTDGAAPDRSFDLLAQGRIAAQLQRVHFGDTTLLPAGRILAMITIDPARALGMESEIGSIEVGKKADLVLLDANQAHLQPAILAPPRVVYAADGHDVETVIVEGRIVMEGRLALYADEAAIFARANDALGAALDRAGYGDPERLHPDFWQGIRYGSTVAENDRADG